MISEVSPTEMEGSGTVLLVEDEEMVRGMATAMLKRLGFKVLEAKDGVEAVEVFRQRQNEIRLVLCNLSMPRMNGWETLTALRKLVPGVPVILAGGYDNSWPRTESNVLFGVERGKEIGSVPTWGPAALSSLLIDKPFSVKIWGLCPKPREFQGI